MAEFLFKFSKDNRNLNTNKAKFLDHKFPFPYGGSFQQILQTTPSACSDGTPTGFDLVLAEDIDDTGFFQFNLLVPDTFNSVVLYTGPSTPQLDPDDLLILGNNKYYKVLNTIPPLTVILPTDLENVTTQIIESFKANTTIAVPGLGIYSITEDKFCSYPVGQNTLIPAARVFEYDNNMIYDALPLDSYNLGDREDETIKVVRNIVELQQIAPLLFEDCVVYVVNTGEYYLITDNQGTFTLDTSGNRQFSPTRWLLEGADAGLDFVNKKAEGLFEEAINPETAFVENLPWIAQIFGMDGLADGLITPSTFRSTEPEFNPLTEAEVRCILCNSLGWARDTNDNYDGIVPLNERKTAIKVDFTFDGSNNLDIETGDKGIFLNQDTSVTYQAVAPTDLTTISLEDEAGVASPTTASPGDRISGIIHNKQTVLSIKGLAMDLFSGNLPADAGDDKENLNADFSVTIDGFQIINYQIWQVVGEQTELNIGMIYRLRSYEDELPTLIDPNTGFTTGSPIGNITVIDDFTWEFQVDPDIDPFIQTYYKWEELNLNFSIYPVRTIVDATQFEASNWLGYKGSRGSLYGYTVSNTLLELTNPTPLVLEKSVAVTCVTTETELQKAKKLEPYIGSPNFNSHIQYDVLESDKSFVNDFWLEPQLREYQVTTNFDIAFDYYEPGDELITIDTSTGELFINEQTTGRFLPGAFFGSVADFGVGRDGRAYWMDENLNLYKFKNRSFTSQLDLFEINVELINRSHGYYLQTLNVSRYVIKRDGRQIRIYDSDTTNTWLFKEYPFFQPKTVGGAGDIHKFTDLLTGDSYHVARAGEVIQLDRTVPSGCLLYDNSGNIFPVFGKSSNRVYNLLQIPLTEPGATDIVDLQIVEEYASFNKHNQLAGEFSYFKLRYRETDFGAVNVTKYKYLYCESLFNAEIESVALGSGVPTGAKGTVDVLDIDPLLTENNQLIFYY